MSIAGERASLGPSESDLTLSSQLGNPTVFVLLFELKLSGIA